MIGSITTLMMNVYVWPLFEILQSLLAVFNFFLERNELQWFFYKWTMKNAMVKPAFGGSIPHAVLYSGGHRRGLKLSLPVPRISGSRTLYFRFPHFVFPVPVLCISGSRSFLSGSRLFYLLWIWRNVAKLFPITSCFRSPLSHFPLPVDFPPSLLPASPPVSPSPFYLMGSICSNPHNFKATNAWTTHSSRSEAEGLA